MAGSMRAVPALAVVLLASVFVVADDTQKDTSNSTGAAQAAAGSEVGKESKAGAKAAAKSPGQSQARQVRLTKPWSNLTSLSDDQKKQINQIHRKAVQEKKAIEQREKDEIMALLDDRQKAEVTALEEKATAERKAKAAQQKAATPAADASQKSGDSGATTASAEKAADK